MDWFLEFGNYAQYMPDTPALAFNMAMGGPSYHGFGLRLAHQMQNTAEPIEVYPDTSSPLAQLGA